MILGSGPKPGETYFNWYFRFWSENKWLIVVMSVVVVLMFFLVFFLWLSISNLPFLQTNSYSYGIHLVNASCYSDQITILVINDGKLNVTLDKIHSYGLNSQGGSLSDIYCGPSTILLISGGKPIYCPNKITNATSGNNFVYAYGPENLNAERKIVMCV